MINLRLTLYILLLTAMLSSCTGTPAAPSADTGTVPVATPMLLGVTIEAPLDGPSVPTPGSPSGAIDPTLPAWTILYYASADNDSAPYVWNAINQMEAVGSSEQVRVVADVDWAQGDSRTGSQPVRYFIAGDTDPDLILSEGAAMLGEANFGDPETLTDFLTWGIDAFPAQRYALILSGYGGSWHGCCLDLDTGDQQDSDALTSAEIGMALASAAQQTGRSLDIVAFSGSLMSQLDVLQAIQPHAAFAVASPDLVPGAGWDYQSLLGPLVADPSKDGRQLAAHMVADYVAYQRDLLGNPFVAMTATDLSRLPTLITALETLGLSLSQSPDAVVTATQDARRGALAYGQAVSSATPSVSLVDLQHAAAILAAYAPTVDLEIAARAVNVAVQEAAVAFDFGPGLPGARGISVYWPATATNELSSYADSTSLGGWLSFLDRFVEVSAGNEAPFVAVSAGIDQPVSSSQPAVVQSEVVGQQIQSVDFVTSLETSDGRRLLLQREQVPSPPTTRQVEPPAYLWPDGRQTSGFIWDSIAGYLYDSAGTSETVALRTVNQAPGPGQLVSPGQFGRANSAALESATLVFPLSNEVPSHIWHEASANGSSLYHQLLARPGDSFTPALQLLDDGGRLELEPGARLEFDESAALYRSARPLQDGAYSVGVLGVALGGQSNLSSVQVTVDSETAVEGFRSYVDGVNNLRFLYPVTWTTPAIVGDTVEASAQDGSTRMRLQRFPEWAADSAALNQDVAATFGPIALLFQDEVTLGGVEDQTARRTVYGYDSVDQGTRTGVLLTFVQDGTGFAIDIDGPQTDEATTLAVSEMLANSWQRLPSDNILNAWTSITVEGQRIPYPSILAYQELNGWHRLSDTPQSFVAVRVQPAARTIPEATTALLATAAEGVVDFTPNPTEQRFFAGHLWDQTTFTYRGADNEPVFGLLLLRQGPGQEIAVWAESPAAGGTEAFARTVLAIASGIAPAPPVPE